MAMKWTIEQQQVIDLRDANILVAAAAGSGKTAVLVERIITRLTKDEHPLNVDELLIVTFTEAAAAEMKERILAAIEKALEEQPENQHLQKQATLIHSAAITTIHSFCLSVIRDHFHRIDLDPVFRIGEEGELKLLKQDIMNQLLELEYQAGNEEFLHFVECVAPGKNDKRMESLILDLYEFSRSNPQPELWLHGCAKKYEIQNLEELAVSSVGQFIRESIAMELEEVIERTKRALDICLEIGGPHHYEEAIRADMVMLEHLQESMKIEAQNMLEGAYQCLNTLEWFPLSRKRPKDVEADKKQLVGDIRNSNKKVVKAWQDKYFYATPEKQLEDIQHSGVLVKELVRLVNAYAQLYSKEKLNRGMLDFNDMEQYALKILTTVDEEHENSLIPSEVAKEYQEKFAEVMIDEYQDSNLVQEAILTSVSKVSQGSYNIFMVGDVKQSIYRFRLSRPELFMDKFNRYDIQEGMERRIDLSKNFRSRSEVLDSTNEVFYQIMRTFLGGVEY
ncbi:MAG: UvrD-helicase domain-containing protein, partial [Eubacteriales bacterium]